MKYIYSYRFLFESPNWLMNLLAAAICLVVPVVGPMVFLGYVFEIIESLHRRKGSPYPDFDTKQLMKYLTRGLWPFLVRLVVLLPLGAIMMIVYIVLVVFMAAGVAKDHPGIVFVLFILFYLV